MAKKWHTTETKSTELETELNRLEKYGYTIFSVMHTQNSGFREYYLIVYYE